MGLGLSSPDGKRVLVTDITHSSIASSHRPLKPGAVLLHVACNGTAYPCTSLAEVSRRIAAADSSLEITIAPLIDRFGFVVSRRAERGEGEERGAREQIRGENRQLRKWKKRITSEKAWHE